MGSIAEKGVLQPVIVYRAPDIDSHKYVLVAGERRFRASKNLGRPHIPARILLNEPAEADIIQMQLIENLQRKDLNPIDEALGYAKYYCNRMAHPELNIDFVVNDLISYQTRPEQAKKNLQ
jgi:ParB/RepB/Spo0J family partition protein